MIRTATQLKAKVRNLSRGDSTKAQTLIRNFIMERFLERIALSQYRNNFILKGGMLVSAVVGLDTRATMDIDTTVKSLELSKENAVKIFEEIIAVEIPDAFLLNMSKIVVGFVASVNEVNGWQVTMIPVHHGYKCLMFVGIPRILNQCIRIHMVDQIVYGVQMKQIIMLLPVCTGIIGTGLFWIGGNVKIRTVHG